MTVRGFQRLNHRVSLPTNREEETAMSYRCELCRNVVPHGNPLLRHIIYRPNSQIEREVKVCGNCKASLDDGIELATLLRVYRKRVAAEARLSQPLVLGKTISSGSKPLPVTTPAPAATVETGSRKPNRPVSKKVSSPQAAVKLFGTEVK